MPWPLCRPKKTCCFAANLSPCYNRGYPVWSPFICRKLVPGGRVIRLPDPLSDGRANVSYNSLQNLESRLHEKQKVVSARRMTRLARSRLFRALFFFHANSLARPAESSWKETIRACTTPFVVSVWVGRRGQLVFLIVSTHLSRHNYSRLPITRTF